MLKWIMVGVLLTLHACGVEEGFTTAKYGARILSDLEINGDEVDWVIDEVLEGIAAHLDLPTAQLTQIVIDAKLLIYFQRESLDDCNINPNDIEYCVGTTRDSGTYLEISFRDGAMGPCLGQTACRIVTGKLNE